jgi:hypothetical protein
MFIISYYKVLWNFDSDLRNKLVLESLVGLPDEQAFLEIRSNEVCMENNMAPLIYPKRRLEENSDKCVSVFVNHIDAVSQMRKNLAFFFSD